MFCYEVFLQVWELVIWCAEYILTKLCRISEFYMAFCEKAGTESIGKEREKEYIEIFI